MNCTHDYMAKYTASIAIDGNLVGLAEYVPARSPHRPSYMRVSWATSGDSLAKSFVWEPLPREDLLQIMAALPSSISIPRRGKNRGFNREFEQKNQLLAEWATYVLTAKILLAKLSAGPSV